MYLRYIPICLVLLLAMVQNTCGLSCLPCDDLKCPEISCPGGRVQDPCGCCLECAKQKNELCGGPFHTRGKCDRGLECVRRGLFFHGSRVCRARPEDKATHINTIDYWLKHKADVAHTR